MYFLHGWPKILAGPQLWQGLAKGVGLSFVPTFWGFMAAVFETLGGVLIAVGLLFRPAVALLFLTMAGAVMYHLRKGDPFVDWSRPVEMLIVFAALFLIGPGRYSVDEGLIKSC
jgi:putative oxidoreductase